MALNRFLRAAALCAVAGVQALSLAACSPDQEKEELRRKLADAEARAAAAERRAGSPVASAAAPAAIAPQPQVPADTTPFGQPMDDTRPMDERPEAANPAAVPNPAVPGPSGQQGDQRFKITP